MYVETKQKKVQNKMMKLFTYKPWESNQTC